MSLSREPLYSLLRNRFVCGYRNIINESYAGDSGIHEPDGNAVDTTNGAGPHNIQVFVLTPDGVVLHCLPGFWNPNDLAAELELAERLNVVWNDGSVLPDQKTGLFKRMQLDHARLHSPEMVARSQMQGFDKRFERAHRLNSSDTIADASLIERDNPDHAPDDAFKTTDRIMHERMAARAFVPYDRFDVAKFADYGTMVYDKHEDNLDESGRTIDPEARTHLLKAGGRAGARPGSGGER